MSEDPLYTRALEALSCVIDPEIGLNVVDLGLVYGIEPAAHEVLVRLTMTTPACPLAEQVVRDAEERLRRKGFTEVRIELVWDPPWSSERMSLTAKRALGWKR